MSAFVINQTYVFFIFILCGIFIALIFDVFRILRKSFKTPDIITYIEDVVFWLLTCIILAYAIFRYNNGEIRAYIFIGLIIGLIIYLLLISKYVIKTCVAIISTTKSFIRNTMRFLSYPLKILYSILRKLILRPIAFICINIRKKFVDNSRKIWKIIVKRARFKKDLSFFCRIILCRIIFTEIAHEKKL